MLLLRKLGRFAMSHDGAARRESRRSFAVGDRVQVQGPHGWTAAVILEDRGPLGPNGERVYRLEWAREKTGASFELVESSLRAR